MKAKVLISFTDKYTGKKYKAGDNGDIIDVTAERFNEITKKGRLIEAYEEPATAKTENK